MFEQQVAHGYFIMSIAAGLFVDSYEKNPVLLNYGIDELRFTKPFIPAPKFISALLVKKNYRVIKELLKTVKILKEVMILKKEL
jgi:oxepin-CoA hydrolase/3-oxo-5,6-dehydrosuberyl-CoA semialdehyde dehydrogenase